MSKKPKLTPWFDGDVKPARVGRYERDYYPNEDVDPFDWWAGSEWRYSSPTGATAYDQVRRWRGLASNPMTAGRTSKG